MKKVLRVVLSSFVFIGTVIGAGFASGKEIVTYFYKFLNYPLLVGLFCFVLFFLVTKTYLNFGRKSQSGEFYEVTRGLNKIGKVIDGLVLICFLVVSSAMTAGVGSLFREVFCLSTSFKGFKGQILLLLPQVISLILACFIVAKGLNGIKGINLIIVPFIIFVIWYLCLNNIGANKAVSGKEVNFLDLSLKSALYVSMNLTLASAMTIKMGKGMEKSEVFLTSLISSVIISATISIFIYTIKGNESALKLDMPLLFFASAKGEGLAKLILGGIVLCGIFTTKVSALLPLYEQILKWSKDKFFTSLFLFLSVLSLSMIGFSKIISYFYPVQSGVGVVLLFLIILRRKQKQ